ncbi:MAG: penicillin amidase [Actinomycetota bacterium]|nr:penicillin amidase [Actinomycetota bacterium]
MPRRRLLRVSLLAVAALLVTVIVGTVVVSVVYIRRPFPDQEGELTLSGLKGKVVVHRDQRGVPQIYADSAEDLFLAQGYVQAQDRFFQMDWRRHITAGRLSELVGKNEDALRADKLVRTLGWRQVAAEEVTQLPETQRTYLESFSRGVNDYLADRSSSELSLNYPLLGLANPVPRVEPWTAEDSMAWFKAMAWDLKGNYSDELSRGRVLSSVKDVKRVQQLYPEYPYERNSPILSKSSATPARPSTQLPGSGSAGLSSGGAETPATTPASGTGGLGGSGALSRGVLEQHQRTGSETSATASNKAAGSSVPRTADAASATERELLSILLESSQAQETLSSVQEGIDSISLFSGSGDGLGSNSWVISGEHTATGKPMLANDPHLSSEIPGVWYQTGLHCRNLSEECPYDVTGYSFAGVPGIIIGHNREISWGITNLGTDTTDFYLEKIEGNSYESDGELVDMTVRNETIKIAGEDPVTIEVRSTPHGPVVSDVLDEMSTLGSDAPVPQSSPTREEGYAVSLAWTAAKPTRNMQAVFEMNRATDFAGFRNAAWKLDAPAQNFVYADTAGHIGYQATGIVPLRNTELKATTLPANGTWPMPGWDSRYTWTGKVKQTHLPWHSDPEQGYIVAANQAVIQLTTAPYFTQDWDYGYRAQRIKNLLQTQIDQGHKMTAADLQAIQGDTTNPIASELVPLLLACDVDDFTLGARDMLKGWDGQQQAKSDAAAYFNAVWSELLDLTFFDEMPKDSRPDGGDRWFEVVRELLQKPKDIWWDDRRTPNVVETRDEILRKSLVEARLQLTRVLGKDPDRWQWGRLHRLSLIAQPLGDSSSTRLLYPLLNQGPLEVGGGSSIVNALSWDAASGTFDVTSAPSLRMVVDLANFDDSRWVNQTGQSGHPGHENYADQLKAWQRNRTFPWPFSEAAVQKASERTLTLEPPSE